MLYSGSVPSFGSDSASVLVSFGFPAGFWFHADLNQVPFRFLSSFGFDPSSWLVRFPLDFCSVFDFIRVRLRSRSGSACFAVWFQFSRSAYGTCVHVLDLLEFAVDGAFWFN